MTRMDLVVNIEPITTAIDNIMLAPAVEPTVEARGDTHEEMSVLREDPTIKHYLQTDRGTHHGLLKIPLIKSQPTISNIAPNISIFDADNELREESAGTNPDGEKEYRIIGRNLSEMDYEKLTKPWVTPPQTNQLLKDPRESNLYQPYDPWAEMQLSLIILGSRKSSRKREKYKSSSMTMKIIIITKIINKRWQCTPIVQEIREMALPGLRSSWAAKSL